MALPATSLASFFPEPSHVSEPQARGSKVHELTSALRRATQLQVALEYQSSERVLALGIPELDASLPHGGLLQGAVTELQVRGSGGAATSLALCVCRAAQAASSPWQLPRESGASRESPVSRASEVSRAWCAFIDPSASLFAPGVARLGVDLGRLLVVRPNFDAVERIAVRIAEARAVAMLVIDLRGALGSRSNPRGTSRAQYPHPQRHHSQRSHNWQSVVRRLALAVKNLPAGVLLITDAESPRALPLPVAMRLELSRVSASHLEVRVAKERTGRVSPPRLVALSALEASS